MRTAKKRKYVFSTARVNAPMSYRTISVCRKTGIAGCTKIGTAFALNQSVQAVP